MKFAALGFCVVMAQAMPASAQQQEEPPLSEKAADEKPRERIVIDILAVPKADEVDALFAEECEEEQEAASISGEIVVCRKLRDGSDVSGFDKADWERRYAEKTQGIKTPNVMGAGGSIIMPGEGSLATITVTQKVGKPPPPALIIDVEALPEAPPGSDADRVARGLPPLEEDDSED